MAHSGYDRQRFTSVISDTFDCIICCQVVMTPYQCHGCGKLFCENCINDWTRKNPTVKCPNRCTSQISPIYSKALIRLYNNFEIRCSNAKCNKPVKLSDLAKHQQACLKPRCWNFDNCDRAINDSIKGSKPVCSMTCQFLYRLKQSSNNRRECFGNKKAMYDILGELMIAGNKPIINDRVGGVSLQSIGLQIWDEKKCGTGVQFFDNGTSVFLKQQSYVFRTVIAMGGFDGGINYWEIIADTRTQNQLKIGVACSRDFDLNSAFCDHPFGFAYYGMIYDDVGLGQLRHNSNASGTAYGKRFKKQGVLGCCLNMNTGTLSFALNGEYFGVAYRDAKLKSGMIYPAVSLLHCAGCKIRSGMPVPSYFKD